jgi:hypothetical protein
MDKTRLLVTSQDVQLDDMPKQVTQGRVQVKGVTIQAALPFSKNPELHGHFKF